MKVRLVKDAPWPQVVMPCGLIVKKTDFIEQGDCNLLAIQQWIEDEEHAEPEPIINTSYESMTKIDLRLLCKERNIEIEGLSKEQLIEKLLERKENESSKNSQRTRQTV